MWTTRILGGAAMAFGLALLIGDLAGEGPFRPRALGEVWYALSPGTLNLTQAVIERYVAEWLWNPVALNILLSPAALVLGGVGSTLVVAGEVVGRTASRRRRRPSSFGRL